MTVGIGVNLIPPGMELSLQPGQPGRILFLKGLLEWIKQYYMTLQSNIGKFCSQILNYCVFQQHNFKTL